ncbi:hypothetical protein O4160_08460 [Rhodococcus sp. IEGM 1401]|uniref:hypothetical protein n=1 Tax=unclassified Rhodococcus (in: high G+C Gram-positive bacteria) TaxID=192944 RepID=UPI0022B5739C|nr:MULTISPECIES: hypothetical protein [unclassified Rhodococcus (in: high G+C Gram-positive bacteria)]MCZ4560873.1 hypothetical protein [Rhodococcus sp. IEGM 1401]MDI9921013.1 hypothetical protein [Rhodococcus sp. IEGM 1372]MDV8033386.1 hypothetical protein [Rhodococcus sp. IEGM 1414]
MLRKWLALIVVVILGAAPWNITTPDRPVAAEKAPSPKPSSQRTSVFTIAVRTRLPALSAQF